MLRTLGDGADGRLKIEFGSMKLGFFRRRNSSKPRRWVRGIRHAKLAAKGGRRYPRALTGGTQ
jgi:hypothetical protein